MRRWQTRFRAWVRRPHFPFGLIGDTVTLDFDAEYNTRASVPEHADIVAAWERDATVHRSTHRLAQIGLKYGPSPRQTLDLFRPDLDSVGAAILFIHGGDWQSLSPALFSHFARGANERGLTFAVAGYDLCPEVKILNIIGQIRAAAIALHRRIGRAVVAVGHGAGGHLAACLVATDWSTIDPALPPDLVPAGLALSGIFDLKPVVATSLNAKLGLDDNEAHRLSPLNWQIAAGRTFDAWVGEDETVEFQRQARDLATAWGEREVNARMVVVPGANHFDVVTPLADPNSTLTHRLVELARGTKTARPVPQA
jgi:arylformamidase